MSDFTARKRAEEALHPSERRFRALIEHSSASVALIGVDGTLLYVSPEALRVNDAESEEVSGTDAFGWLHPDDIQEGVKVFTEVLEQPGGVATLEVRALTPSGSYRWVEAVVTNLLDDPDVGALVVNSRDVTDRKLVEQQLAEREASLRLLLEQLPATMWTTDLDLRITLAVGAGYESVAGNPTKELVGKTVAEASEQPDPGIIVKEHRRALSGRAGNFEQEWRGRTWRSHVEPLRSPEGIICGTIGVALDVTESMLVAEQLERSVQVLRKVDVERLELVQRLVNAIEDERVRVAREMHDHVGQLLTSASLLAKSLEEEAVGTELEEPLGSLRNLMEQAQVATRSIVASIRAVDLDEGGLPEAIARLAEEVRQRHGIDVDVLFLGLNGRLHKEREIAVYRVVQEAMTNAIQHGSPEAMSVVGSVQGEMVVVLVEDDGRGFSSEEVMEGPPAARLGILGMQERAIAVGGDIHVESHPGSGTTVRVRVPAETAR
jgi:PAS domain S-box-containing protein